MVAIGALDSGNPDGEDETKKADRLAARAARFNKQLVGNRHKEVSCYQEAVVRCTADRWNSWKKHEFARGRGLNNKD
jgi:hypothetical protein